jgi:hypothetical protein
MTESEGASLPISYFYFSRVGLLELLWELSLWLPGMQSFHLESSKFRVFASIGFQQLSALLISGDQTVLSKAWWHSVQHWTPIMIA